MSRLFIMQCPALQSNPMYRPPGLMQGQWRNRQKAAGQTRRHTRNAHTPPMEGGNGCLPTRPIGSRNRGGWLVWLGLAGEELSKQMSVVYRCVGARGRRRVVSGSIALSSSPPCPCCRLHRLHPVPRPNAPAPSCIDPLLLPAAHTAHRCPLFNAPMLVVRGCEYAELLSQRPVTAARE